jgi:glucokinase
VAFHGGIDLGGTKVQAIVLDSVESRVLGQARRPTPRSGGPPAVAEALAECLQDAAQGAGLATAVLAGVGVGAPGEVDPEAGTVARAGNLPDWEAPYALAAVLSKRLGTRVSLGNDVDVATQAEFALGAGRDARSLIGVFWGTGIGGGLVLDNEPWRGRGAAGEIGHMVIVRGGARCPCGRRGCVEAYAGRRAMETRARREVARGRHTYLFKIMERHGRESLTSGIWARALDEGDKLAHHLIDRAVQALGAGIASAVNLLDVEMVVIGGGLGVRFGEEVTTRIASAMEPHLFVETRPPAVRVAELGDLGGAIGAALLSERARAGVPIRAA